MCLCGGIGERLPLQAEMSEMKSVNCGEALTDNDEGNPQPSHQEIDGRFRDYNHSIQTGHAEDDGIVQTTTASNGRSGKPDVVQRRSGFKIHRSQDCGSSSLPGGTIFYKLVTYNKRNEKCNGCKSLFLRVLRSNGQRLIEGKQPFVKDQKAGQYRIELADKIESEKVVESDLFFLKHQLTYNCMYVENFDFVQIQSH